MEIKVIEEMAKNARLLNYEQLDLIPATSGVYTAWLDTEARCFYVGKAMNMKDRIKSHFGGQRGSDQFCLYVYDTYLHDQRCRLAKTMTTRQVNDMTAHWIQEKVRFRCVELPEEELSDAERYLKRAWKPILPFKE